MSDKSILILYTNDDFGRRQPLHRAGITNMYNRWHDIAKQRGYNLQRASIHWFREGHFFQYWQHAGKGEWKKIVSKTVPSVIYDKTQFIHKKTGRFLPEVHPKKIEIGQIVPFVNQPEFSILVDNKLNQSVIFEKYMPKTRFHLIGDVLKNPNKKLMVLKKLYGSGGKNVDITRASEYKVTEPTIEQDFVAAKKNGELKDLRVVFNGDEPRYAYNRVAKSRSLFTNVHQGAKTLWVELSDIPDVVDLAREITKPLRVFPKRIYSLDFLIDSETNKPYLIEVNTMPGFSVFRTAANKTLQEREKLINTYLNFLTDYLIS